MTGVEEMNKERYVVGGIAFADEKAAERAKEEAMRIEALNANINYDNPKAVASLYTKAQKNHVFQTPVGISYMLQLQEQLIRQGVEPDKIDPIELPTLTPGNENTVSSAPDNTPEEPFAEEEKKLEQPGAVTREGKILEAKLKAQKKIGQKQLDLIKTQWAVIAAMAVIILAMFIISLTGNNPTIINYRSKILNQYAEWEQELKEREAAISQKEHAAGAGLEQGVHSEIDTD